MVAQRECCLSLRSGPHQPHCHEQLRGMDNSGKKFDTGKAPTLRGCLSYFAKALTAVANVSAYGAKKYNNTDYAPNWKKVEDGLGRYSDADARHLLAEAIDGLYDPESHLLHAAHHAWNSLARLELLLDQGNPLEENPQLETFDFTHFENAIAKLIEVTAIHPVDPTPSTPHAPGCKCWQCIPSPVDKRNGDRRVGRKTVSFEQRFDQRRKAS